MTTCVHVLVAAGGRTPQRRRSELWAAFRRLWNVWGVLVGTSVLYTCVDWENVNARPARHPASQRCGHTRRPAPPRPLQTILVRSQTCLSEVLQVPTEPDVMLFVRAVLLLDAICHQDHAASRGSHEPRLAETYPSCRRGGLGRRPRRYIPGATPNRRLNALLKETSDS